MRAGVCVAYIHTRVCICVSERVKGQGVKNASDELAEAQANTARGAVESTLIKARRARASRERERFGALSLLGFRDDYAGDVCLRPQGDGVASHASACMNESMGVFEEARGAIGICESLQYIDFATRICSSSSIGVGPRCKYRCAKSVFRSSLYEYLWK